MKKYLLSLLFLYVSCGTLVLAQTATPDTTTALHRKRFRWHNCVVIRKGGQELTGYADQYLTYAPKGKFTLMTSPAATKKDYLSIKVKELQSISYAGLRYQSVKPQGSDQEYMAREALTGRVSLYVYTEFKSVPLPIPLAGAVLAASIPYDNSLLFLRRGDQTVKVNRGAYSEMMMKYFADHPAIVEKIRNRTYKYRDTEALVREYNSLPAGSAGN
jgi:hypothetical protein